MAEDYCELCDLPLSTCVHGLPPRTPEQQRAAPRTAAPRAATVRSSRTTAGPVAGRAVSRVTPPAAFRTSILQVLTEAGGSLETESVMARLEELMADVLLERDRQVAPGGEVRWQTSARKERKAMIDEGLVVAALPGVWQLTGS